MSCWRLSTWELRVAIWWCWVRLAVSSSSFLSLSLSLWASTIGRSVALDSELGERTVLMLRTGLDSLMSSNSVSTFKASASMSEELRPSASSLKGVVMVWSCSTCSSS